MIHPGQIAAMRKSLGISQAELAKRSGVSQSFITKIERGMLDPAFSKVLAISDALEDLQKADHRVSTRRAAEFMNPDVLVFTPGDIAEAAAAWMARRRISQIPVVNGEIVEGTITDASLMDFVVTNRNDPEALKTPVRELMDGPLPQVGPEAAEEDLITLLKTFPAILVRNNVSILGIVTKFDILSKRVADDRARDKKEGQTA
jgi:predicted transcriptional regulator